MKNVCIIKGLDFDLEFLKIYLENNYKNILEHFNK